MRTTRPRCRPSRNDADDEQRQRAELGDGRDAGKQRAELHADDVGGAGKDDRAGREVVGPGRMRRGVEPEDAHEILAEHRGDAAERGGANQHELRPSVEKGVRPSPAFAQIDIHAAGLGHRRRELRERQRAAQHDQAAEHPDAEHQHRIGHARRDAGRRAEDAAADGDADHEADRAQQAEPPDEGGHWGVNPIADDPCRCITFRPEQRLLC